jgi:hypothetical protein
MSVSSEHEIAHARDVTITECQERLREVGFRSAADALGALRIPEQVSAATQVRLKQAGELNYRILTTAGDRRHADAWASLAKDLWEVLRIYELPGKGGG